MFRVLLTAEAEKQLAQLDKRYQKAVVQALAKLGKNPQIGQPLRYELKGKYRLRISRYRIIYQFDYKSKIIWVLTVEHRKDVYR